MYITFKFDALKTDTQIKAARLAVRTLITQTELQSVEPIIIEEDFDGFISLCYLITAVELESMAHVLPVWMRQHQGQIILTITN